MVFEASAGPVLPPVDERLAVPGGDHEVIDGVVVPVPPCDDDHGIHHMSAGALIQAHVARGFYVACDMLTRTSLVDDIAPDISVFPQARDPVTGRRLLEHLAFEIVATQRITDAGRRASKLTDRGVRRVFAIDTGRGRVLEWSNTLATWNVLDLGAAITDLVFAVPVPVAALLDVAGTQDRVARAMIAGGTPSIEALAHEARQQGRQEGREQGRREGQKAGATATLLTVLAARGIALADSDRARMLAEEDPARLTTWTVRATIATTIAEIFDEAADT